MRTKIFAAALIASTAIAAPAFAQDVTFSGPRAEAVVGWDRIDDGSTNGTEASDGVVYGGQVGYDIQRGGTVFGVEGEVTGSTNRERAENVFTPGDAFRVRAGRDLYVGGRVGFVAGGNTLIYAKGGYTNAGINTRYVSGAGVFDVKENLDGWRAGAGAEMKLNDKVYLKGEYRYSNYGKMDGVDVDLDRHQVVAGVGVRF